jgi:tetratricopeptide (TPR) repeat protein
LGVAWGNLRESDLAKENYQKAFDLRRRVSVREDYAILAYYYNDVIGDLEKSNQIYELYAQVIRDFGSHTTAWRATTPL